MSIKRHIPTGDQKVDRAFERLYDELNALNSAVNVSTADKTSSTIGKPGDIRVVEGADGKPALEVYAKQGWLRSGPGLFTPSIDRGQGLTFKHYSPGYSIAGGANVTTLTIDESVAISDLTAGTAVAHNGLSGKNGGADWYHLSTADYAKIGNWDTAYSWGNHASAGYFVTASAAALTKTDDTNVTITLGGAPTTALLAATSITLGWTGTLADSRITSAANWNTAYGWGNHASAGYLTANQNITLSGDVSGTGTTAITTTIGAAKVTLAMMANMATSSLIYRRTAATGVPEVNTLAQLKTDLLLTGTNSGDQTITLTSDVTGSGVGSFATTIAAGVVTLAKMANMATSSLIYRKTAGTGVPEVNTLAQLKTDLLLTGTNSGDNPGVTSVGATSPITSSGGTTPTIGITQTSITSVGTLGAGTWQAGTIAVGYGGTAATTRKAASSSIANFGQLETHGTYTNFNLVKQWGGTFIQGSANGPGTGESQFYQIMLSLGSNYDWGSGSVYAHQIAIGRNTVSPYISIRSKEGGTDEANWTSWSKIKAGYADAVPASGVTAGAFSGAFTFSGTISASNLSGTNTGDNAGVTSVGATSPITSSGGATPTIGITQTSITSVGTLVAGSIPGSLISSKIARSAVNTDVWDGGVQQTSTHTLGSGTRSNSLNPNSYTYGFGYWEFKNTTFFAGNGSYRGLLTLAPWVGTTSSTGDPTYQLMFVPAGVSSTNPPAMYIRAGIDVTWGSWSKFWHDNNDGSGSGLDADLLDGLHLNSTTTNNEVNKVVRTDGNGYTNFGWINTASGDAGTTTITRIYASYDGYIRYYTLANFKTQIVTTAAVNAVAGSFLKSDAGDARDAGYTTDFWNTAGDVFNDNASNTNLSLYNATPGADAFMTFHVGGDFAAYFGLGGAENDFMVGGWSMGNVRYRVIHTGNLGYITAVGAVTSGSILGSLISGNISGQASSITGSINGGQVSTAVANATTSVNLSGTITGGQVSSTVATASLSTQSDAVLTIAENTTAATRYLTFVTNQTGYQTQATDISLFYNPSTNVLTAGTFSGSGGSLTSLPASSLTGQIPSAVLGSSTLYVGTTAIALNRASATQALTGITNITASGTLNGQTDLQKAGVTVMRWRGALSSAPASPVGGDCYWNTVSLTFGIYDGSSWQNF